jgi:hypothetical protein
MNRIFRDSVDISIDSDTLCQVNFELLHVIIYADELATVLDNFKYLNNPMAYKLGQAFEVTVNQ